MGKIIFCLVLGTGFFSVLVGFIIDQTKFKKLVFDARGLNRFLNLGHIFCGITGTAALTINLLEIEYHLCIEHYGLFYNAETNDHVLWFAFSVILILLTLALIPAYSLFPLSELSITITEKLFALRTNSANNTADYKK